MIGAFNPYTAGTSPQQPNISLDTVSQLLGGANQGVQALVGGIQKAGEIDRSSKVNELLASGGLQGLTEEQQRQKLAQMTGGQSINPLVQANAADVMANQRANEIAQASAAAALGLEDRKSINDQTLERLKSEVGLAADTSLAKTKGDIEQKAAEQLFGYDSKLLGQKGSQAQGLAKFENDLKIEAFKNNLDPNRYAVVKYGDVPYAVDKSSGLGKEIGLPEESKGVSFEKSLSSEAKEAFRNLTPNQKENLKEAYQNGNIGYKPYKVDPKTKEKSGGFWYNLDEPTGLGIAISNVRRKER